MPSEIRITATVAVVLRAFLDDVEAGRYGMELMADTGLPSGTLYPVLARLERAGWLRSAREKIDPAVEGRPPRRYFTLDPSAVELARYEVAALAQKLQLNMPPTTARGRLGLAGGLA